MSDHAKEPLPALPSSVCLYWLPLGAGPGAHVVRWNGRVFEMLVARHEHRRPRDLYHSALQVSLDGDRFVVEMAPIWGNREPDRGVVLEGAVGFARLGRTRYFRYEVRRWHNGVIPDLLEAVASPVRVSESREQAAALLDLVPGFPAAVWGRDQLGAGEMWNSNSLVSWLLARSGHRIDDIRPPANGRAPGWAAGLVVASRDATAAYSQSSVPKDA
jgi:hypothetical protein